MSHRRDQRGAALVEAAIVMPLLMFFILGVIDYGMWAYQRSQVSSAARDGARTALIAVTGTDCTYPCSANNTLVRNAIKARLGSGQTFSFTVQCMSGSSTTPKTCVVEPTTVDRDRVKVTVTWTRPAMTFVSKVFGASTTVSSSSTMTISG
jgi:Flp pilus assembly protein TadG